MYCLCLGGFSPLKTIQFCWKKTVLECGQWLPFNYFVESLYALSMSVIIKGILFDDRSMFSQLASYKTFVCHGHIDIR